jgi:hypothetical protein
VLYRLFADLTLLVHLAFVAFVMLGGFLVLRWPRLAWLHVPAVLWGAGIEIAGGICPLTPLENALRHAAGDAGYAGGFVEHYLVGLLYPTGLTRSTQFVLAGLVVVVNAVAYYLVLKRRRN